ALEVWIGTDGRTGDQQHFVGENLGDWFNMLNQGILRSGVADSDTHKRGTTQLNARTYVASAVTDPGMLGPEAPNLAANIVAGKPATRDRYRVIPNFEHVAGTDFTVTTVNDFPSIPGASHFTATDTLNLTGITSDEWVVVLVRGTDGVSHPLFPYLPNSLKQS